MIVETGDGSLLFNRMRLYWHPTPLGFSMLMGLTAFSRLISKGLGFDCNQLRLDIASLS